MTMYEILIKYANSDRWNSYYERYSSSEIVVGAAKAQRDHPRNQFKLKPVKENDLWHFPSGKKDSLSGDRS